MRIHLLLLFLIPFSLTGQSAPDQPLASPSQGRYHVVQYNSDNGLPQNTVNDLLMDQNHFLWIATQNGLVRWDGHRFRTYNTANTAVLKSNRFSLLSASTDGKILIKSHFDDSVICRVTVDYGIEKDTAYTRLPMKLVSYHSNGIFDYGKLVAKVSASRNDLGEVGLLNRLYHARAFWIFNEHELVVADGQGYYYLNNDSGTIRCFPGDWRSNDRLKAFPVGNLLFVCRNDTGFSCFRQGRIVDVRPDQTVKSLFLSSAMANNTEFFIHAKGSSTLIRRHNDFYTLRIDNNTLTATLLFGDLACMENQPVYTMIYDSLSRMLLLGTQNAGLWCITPELFRPLTFRSKNFIDNVFMSFQPLRNGLILTNSGILDHADDRRSSLFADTAKIDRVCIYRAGDSSIWCSKDKRLYHYDPAFRKGVLIDTAQLESYITGMTTDSENILWISTFSSLIKIENGKLKPVVDRFRDFINHTIESIAAITPTKLWVATRNGLYVFDKTTGQIEPQPILPDTYVRTIFRARDRSLWIGTYGSGYYKYDRGKFYRMPLDADKYLEEANGFLEDNKGFLWISTNHGLFSIFKADLDKIAQGYNIEPFFYYYDKSYGLATNEFNGGCNPSAEEDSHGRFYFPSMNGLVCFSPDSCRGELPDKALYLDAIYVDSTAKYYGEKMNIDPDFTRMQVQVSTPFYGSAENLRIEYCLNPDTWYPVNADGKILINRLPAGNYNLRIRKRNGWHTGDYATMTIPFSVRPYWYNTPVFWVVLWVVILLLVVQLRTRFLRRQNLRLQIMVNERTQELEKSTLIKENLLSIIMHDMRSPLNAQNFLIEQLYHDIRHVSLDTAQQLLRGLLDSGKSIAQFSADFLMWYDSQQEHFTVRKRQVPMLPFVEALLHVYRHVTDRPGLSLHYDVTPDLVAYSDENLLGIVVRNLLDNAIKHTPNGCITIKAFRDDLRVVIEVTDTGRGMHPDKIKELCGPSSTARASGHSFGYRFIREFSQRLGAELNIVSEPGAGTTVTVSFVG